MYISGSLKTILTFSLVSQKEALGPLLNLRVLESLPRHMPFNKRSDLVEHTRLVMCAPGKSRRSTQQRAKYGNELHLGID